MAGRDYTISGIRCGEKKVDSDPQTWAQQAAGWDRYLIIKYSVIAASTAVPNAAVTIRSTGRRTGFSWAFTAYTGSRVATRIGGRMPIGSSFTMTSAMSTRETTARKPMRKP